MSRHDVDLTTASLINLCNILPLAINTAVEPTREPAHVNMEQELRQGLATLTRSLGPQAAATPAPSAAPRQRQSVASRISNSQAHRPVPSAVLISSEDEKEDTRMGE